MMVWWNSVSHCLFHNPKFNPISIFLLYNDFIKVQEVFYAHIKKEGDEPVNYRHEQKHEINAADLIILRQRLRSVMQQDSHAPDGSYLVRSLYFDTPADTALREKLDGVNNREKFRLRYYNRDLSMIRLEKKSKHNGLGSKETARLTAQEVRSILEGDMQWMKQADRPLVQELYGKMICQGLQPKTLVDYMREPFVYAPGNVRVTLDHSIRTGLRSVDFLNPDCVTVPAGDAPIILEVKWDAFLPDLIRDMVQLEGRHTAAFSKYALCRIYD